MARQFERALSLAGEGLAGNPPRDLRAELVQLIKDANYRLHLEESDGVRMASETLTMSLEGNEVGNGLVRQDFFTSKIGALSKLIRRTDDRLSGRPFGTGRPNAKGIKQYISAPQAGSFAVEVKLGELSQEPLPTLSSAEPTLSELVQCFSVLQAGDLESLRARINDPVYYKNFMALARELLPDGDAIRTVDLSASLAGGTRSVRITRTRQQQQPTTEVAEDGEDTVRVTGYLMFADGTAGKIATVRVVDGNHTHTVQVPKALLEDIVKPLWGALVEIQGTKKARANIIQLVDIQPVAETDE